MPIFPVSPSTENKLIERMRKLGVREEDFDESFVRSSGAGGQNVNKTSTCVVLVHKPTGTTVKCQEARSQGLNRFLARRLLLDRIEEKKSGALSAERQRVEKIRRQKRKRSRRAKDKMLENKRHHAAKKRDRAGGRSGEE